MTSLAWVALGSALGGMARYGVSTWASVWSSGPFPWPTFVVNVVGSLVMGAVAAASGHETFRLFVMVGLCGGFTTFSAFSLQTLDLLRAGQWAAAAANAVLSVMGCVVAVALGHAAAGHLVSSK